MSLRSTSISPQESILVLEPGRTEKNYWVDLWRYRELFIILAWHDISVRYKQTITGVAWAVVRPFLTMVVFTVLWQGGRAAQRWASAIRPAGLCRHAAVNVILDSAR